MDSYDIYLLTLRILFYWHLLGTLFGLLWTNAELKVKERLTAAWLSMSTENDTDGDSLSIS